MRKEDGSKPAFHPKRRTFIFNKPGQHSSDIFGDEAIQIIEKHSMENNNNNAAVKNKRGLFLYLPFQAPHTPTQAVESDVNLNQHIRHVKRRKFAGMVTGVDRNIGRIVKTLKETNMWKDTILWFLSDNGGELTQGASNFPLRGGKGSAFQGGIQTPSFIAGGAMELDNLSTKVYNGLLSVVDVFPTILNLVEQRLIRDNNNHNNNNNNNNNKIQLKNKLDGYDSFKSIIGNTRSPRDSIDLPTLLAYDPICRPGCIAASGNSLGCDVQAIRYKDMKLIMGTGGRGDWMSADPSEAYPGEAYYANGGDKTLYNISNEVESSDNLHFEYREGKVAWENLKRLWLFNITDDPNERRDLSLARPDTVVMMKKLMKTFVNTLDPIPHHPNPKRSDLIASKSRTVHYKGKLRKVLDVWPPAPVGSTAGDDGTVLNSKL